MNIVSFFEYYEKFFHTSDFPDAVSTRMFRFSRAIVFLYRQYLVQTFRWYQTSRSTTYHTDEYLPIMTALSQIIKSLSSLAANFKMASFGAASCWCGVIWIWRYQRHSTVCNGTDSASDAPSSPFMTSSSKTIVVVKFRRIDVFMRGQVIEKIQTADDRLLPQLAVKQRDRRRYWWRHVHSCCGEQ